MDATNEYSARRNAWQSKQAIAQRQFISIGNWRLVTALVFVAAAILCFGWEKIADWWLLAPTVVFGILVVLMARVVQERTFAERALRYYDGGLSRLRDEWSGNGERGERFRNLNHIYSEDLDVFGKASLFELLCRARTAAGEDVLAAWLLDPATLEEATARQDAVRELRDRLDLREDLTLLGEDVRSGLRAEVVTRWGMRPDLNVHRYLRVAALILAIGAVLSGAYYLAGGTKWPGILILAINACVMYLTAKKIAGVLHTVDTPAAHLAMLGLMIARIERESFQSEKLKGLQARMKSSGITASARIHKLSRLVELNGWSSHFLMRIIDCGLLWRLQVALAIEAWRRESGRELGNWIEVVGEFEALSSLGVLAFERPAWTFPTLLRTPEASFSAKGLRHPLMSTARCVENDVSLDGNPRALIVSGSNMSGKSTLLRSIGLNTVLAWAGAPVNAAQQSLSLLHTGASLRTTDSLEDNRSRFFAEITRLRLIVDQSRTGPVLFLLDELLSGTNSHDRRIGAAALARGLLKRNTVGLVTTHDLALADIAKEFGTTVENVHFEDRIVNGQVEFDYRLHPGVVTHSNALELMRAVGLDV